MDGLPSSNYTAVYPDHNRPLPLCANNLPDFNAYYLRPAERGGGANWSDLNQQFDPRQVGQAFGPYRSPYGHLSAHAPRHLSHDFGHSSNQPPHHQGRAQSRWHPSSEEVEQTNAREMDAQWARGPVIPDDLLPPSRRWRFLPSPHITWSNNAPSFPLNSSQIIESDPSPLNGSADDRGRTDIADRLHSTVSEIVPEPLGPTIPSSVEEGHRILRPPASQYPLRTIPGDVEGSRRGYTPPPAPRIPVSNVTYDITPEGMVSQEHTVYIPSNTPAFPDNIQNFGAFNENLKMEHARRRARSPYNAQLDAFGMNDSLSSAVCTGEAETGSHFTTLVHDGNAPKAPNENAFQDTKVPRYEAGQPSQLLSAFPSTPPSTPLLSNTESKSRLFSPKPHYATHFSYSTSKSRIDNDGDNRPMEFSSECSWTYVGQSSTMGAGAPLNQEAGDPTSASPCNITDNVTNFQPPEGTSKRNTCASGAPSGGNMPVCNLDGGDFEPVNVMTLVGRCLSDTDKILESLDAFDDLSNEMFERFIEMGPQLVNTLRWVQDALGLSTKTLQKLNYDESWDKTYNELLASLSRNLPKYQAIVEKLPRLPYDKLPEFLHKMEQYNLKFANLAKKITISFEQLQKRHVNVHMSQERRKAYKLLTFELERRRAFDEQWRAVKSERQELYLQLRQQHQKYRRRASMNI